MQILTKYKKDSRFVNLKNGPLKKINTELDEFESILNEEDDIKNEYCEWFC